MVDAKRFYWWLAGVFGGGLVLALVIFGLVMPAVELAGRPAYLDILVEPAAVVEIDGTEYRNAVYELEPGAYTATVRVGGLPAQEVSLELVRGQTTGLYASWSESGGWRYYTAEELAYKQAIREVLPIYSSICGEPASRMNCDAIAVTYDRVPQCEGEECLVISGRRAELTDAVLSLVRDELSGVGYDLDDYRYVYVQNDAR